MYNRSEQNGGSGYGHTPKKRRGFFWWAGLFIGFTMLLAAAAAFVGFRWYTANVEPASPNDTAAQQFVVEDGATARTVAQSLETQDLIKSASAYTWYMRIEGRNSPVLAGDYELSPSMDVAEIVALLAAGENSFRAVTILPGQRLDQVEAALVSSGFSASDVQAALNPANYSGHPALLNKPPAANLEGYIYPDTYNISPSTTVSELIELALDETAAVFTPDVVSSLQSQHGLGVHEAVILGSIVEREVANADDRSKVSQVFLKRLRENISLGSDPTSLYGALLAGLEPAVDVDTLYNTRLYPGLPPGPINNVSEASIQALVSPATTDYLFFVSGDDGTTHFSRTLAEHEALAAQYCIELCRSY